MPLKPYSGRISTFAGEVLARGSGIYVDMEAWTEYDQPVSLPPTPIATVTTTASTSPDSRSYAGTLRVEATDDVEGFQLLRLDEPYRLTIDDAFSLPIRLRRIEAGEPGSFIVEWRSEGIPADSNRAD
ncbi:hypothetical protein [Singulisphaera sp. PoT]|uniref:hypothetical protein n=1 Tax=Singulisphaera sp. PoT TaxID=3411797 RepID=UPI003BF59A9A